MQVKLPALPSTLQCCVSVRHCNRSRGLQLELLHVTSLCATHKALWLAQAPKQPYGRVHARVMARQTRLEGQMENAQRLISNPASAGRTKAYKTLVRDHQDAITVNLDSSRGAGSFGTVYGAQMPLVQDCLAKVRHCAAGTRTWCGMQGMGLALRRARVVHLVCIMHCGTPLRALLPAQQDFTSWRMTTATGASCRCSNRQTATTR